MTDTNKSLTALIAKRADRAEMWKGDTLVVPLKEIEWVIRQYEAQQPQDVVERVRLAIRKALDAELDRPGCNDDWKGRLNSTKSAWIDVAARAALTFMGASLLIAATGKTVGSATRASPSEIPVLTEAGLLNLCAELGDIVRDGRPFLGSLAMKLRPYLKREIGVAIPTEGMCQNARGFILGLDLDIRTWGAMKKHLDMGGYLSCPRIDTQAKINAKGHISKWDVAECIYVLMNTCIKGE